jgi:hypothetical protein
VGVEVVNGEGSEDGGRGPLLLMLQGTCDDRLVVEEVAGTFRVA